MLMPMSVQVTIGGRTWAGAPATVRGTRTVRASIFTSSGQWNPTLAGRMQSGQIGRSQRMHRTPVSRSGWR